MLVIAFIAQNISTGLTFGCIGLLIEPLVQQLNGSRSVISLAIALILLMMGVMSPLVGRWVDRWSLRGTMLIGAAISAVGFYCASRATTPAEFLCSYGLLVGCGFAMCGVLSANKIVALWFPHSVGRASAIVNMPLAIALLPPLFALLLREYGWRQLLEMFALVYVALFGLLLLVRKPAKEPLIVKAAAANATAAIAPFRTKIFWLLSLVIGLVTTSGIVSSTHIVPFAQSVAIGATQAAALLSISGICSVLGAAFYGWLCDRATPFFALLLITASNTVLWIMLTAQRDFFTIAIIVAALGLGGGGLMPTLAALLGRTFSTEQFGSAFGQMNFATLPFTFAAAPLIGLGYDWFGNYRGAFMLEGLLCGIALLIIIAGRAALRQRHDPVYKPTVTHNSGAVL
jgi:MFS family permease